MRHSVGTRGWLVNSKLSQWEEGVRGSLLQWEGLLIGPALRERQVPEGGFRSSL